MFLYLICPPEHPEWLKWQRYYLEHPEEYPQDGNCPSKLPKYNNLSLLKTKNNHYQGIFYRRDQQKYEIVLTEPLAQKGQTWQLITLQPEVNTFWLDCRDRSLISVIGRCNYSGGWLVVEKIIDR